MLLLIRRISVPEFRRHLPRYLLTGVAVVLGVAIFSAAQAANASLRAALRDTIDRIAGQAVLQVTAGEAGLAEPLVEVVRSVPGVRAAVPVIEAVVRSADPGQGNILILGVDLTGDRSLRDYALEGQEDVVSDPLVFLAQPDSLIVSREFADRNRLRDGDRLTLLTAVGPKTFTVRGIMVPRGIALAFGGNIAVMDIYAAQFVFGRDNVFDRIDVALADTVTLEEATARITSRLGPGFLVEPPVRRGRQTESLMEAFALALFFSSIVALLVGMFLIFNAFSVSVTERRSQIGVLRALGVTRRQVRDLFLAEGALLGVVGSGLGLAGGILLGRATMRVMASVVQQTYGVGIAVEELDLNPFWIATALVLGIAASMVGAFLPARAAAAVDPAVALQRGKFQLLFLGENWRRRWLGALLLGSALALASTPWNRWLAVQLGMLAAIFAGLTLLVPTFSHLLARLLRRPMGWAFGLEGRLASDSVLRAPRRTSSTVAALMFSLTFVITSASLSASVKTSLLRWVDSAINPDLIVSASQSLTARTLAFPESMAAELQEVPGVTQVEALRIVTVPYAGRSPLLMSLEMEKYLRRATPILEEGRLEDLVPGMLNTNRVLISNNFARAHGLGRADRLMLDSPSGPQAFEIVGVQVDYNSDQGTLLIDRRTYKRLWKDDRVNAFDLMLAAGADPAEVRREIYRRFAGRRPVFVLTNEDFRGEVLRLANQFWVLTYVQTLVAIVVAVLGIINSLTVSVAERRREIGIVRALGGERRRVRRTVIFEAVCIAVVAVVLGSLIGSTMGYYVIDTVGVSITGWAFPYELPVGVFLVMVPVTLALSLLAAWYPASIAVRMSIVEAVAYE